MKVEVYSYRFAEEILQHERHGEAWAEIVETIDALPLFIWPGKSKKNKKLDVVQQLLNTWFDRRLAVDLKWQFHPLATKIKDSNLRADFRKSFGNVAIQTEIQFGNMARWYSDIFKFQAAYSASLIQVGISLVSLGSLARRIDSNVVNFERARRELPSAELSITLPILLIGLAPDSKTKTIDVSQSKFSEIGEITGKNNAANKWRVVNGILDGVPIEKIGPGSPTGPMLQDTPDESEDED